MSNGNANTTIAYPGPDWQMYWRNGRSLNSFQLDIVGFLAVLGEASVTANAQVSALSRLFYLPRLLPAPQALLPPNRPATLPSTKAWVTSVHTGNVKEHVHHVAHVLLGDSMPTFMVRCVEVNKKRNMRKPTHVDTLLRGVQKSKTASPEKVSPPVKAKATGPLSWVTLLGFLLSVSLFTLSILFGDGMSLLATLCLSFLSTLIGIANKWNLKLPKPTPGANFTGDTVIRYPNGSFLVVRCDEEVARELYFAPEEIEYEIKNAITYRMISLVGTLTLMGGIIFLANARLQLQFAWLGAYGIINAAHWAAAAMPAKSHWDLSCYEVVEQGVEGGPKNKTFTEALWKAILLTKDTRWVRNGDAAAPQTDVWDRWLVKAEEMSKKAGHHFAPLVDPSWPPKNPDKGVVWDQPKEWDAKAAWDAINRETQKTISTGGVRPSKTV